MIFSNKSAPIIVATTLSITVVIGGIFWLTRSKDDQSDSKAQASKPQPTALAPDKSLIEVKNVPTGVFNYGGSTTWAPIRLTVDSSLQAARPEFQLNYTEPTDAAPGSGTGIRMLIEGKLVFSQSSRPIEPQEHEQAKQQGFELTEIPVAIDGVAVAVNPTLTIPGLTLAQLKAIYTGEITNWNQVGGPDLNITPYSRPVNASGTVEYFLSEVVGSENFSEAVEFVNSTTKGLRKLKENKGGIYFASAPEIVSQCEVKALPLGRNAIKLITPYQEPLRSGENCLEQRNQLNIEAFRTASYPLNRKLYVIVKRDGGVNEQAGTAYANLLLSNRGQELITEAGFVRISY